MVAGDGGRHRSVLSHVRNLRNNEVGTGETDGDAQALTSASTPVAIYRTGFRQAAPSITEPTGRVRHDLRGHRSAYINGTPSTNETNLRCS